MQQVIENKAAKAGASLTLICVFLLWLPAVQAQMLPVSKVRSDFKALLSRPAVAARAVVQTISTDSVLIEQGTFYSEATEQVPMLIYKPLGSGTKKLPVVICMHGTGGNKEGMTDVLYRLTKAGFIAVAIDGRYHGQRVHQPENNYVAAITAAWRNKDTAHQTHPFFFDTVYDVWKLIDYLVTRPDVDTVRIGMMGVSKGGIETWMAASVDTRIKVAVPIIAAQSFAWSLANNHWQGRAHTIWAAHQAAAHDLGDSTVTSRNVKALWDKLLPGITTEFDCPSMLRLFAPRPLLLLNTELDQNCPLPGAQLAYTAARAAYTAGGASAKLNMVVEANEPHRFTPMQMELMVQWFKRWL